MSAERPAFVDTNVVVYAFDRSDSRKRDIAATLLEDLGRSGHLRLSTQVLQEFYVTITRKLSPPLSPSQAMELIDDLARWPVHLVDPDTIRQAARLSERAQLSFWDASIVVSAAASGAETLYTEDLNHGQSILGVVVVDPFRS